jgi:predicted peroxiredoxin
MAKYLLIESRDPFEANDVAYLLDLAGTLKQQGNDVTLFLVQNGVLPARKGPRSQRLADLAKAGVKIQADDFSLKERGIPNNRLVAGVESAQLDVVVDRLADGTKTIWH